MHCPSCGMSTRRPRSVCGCDGAGHSRVPRRAPGIVAAALMRAATEEAGHRALALKPEGLGLPPAP